MIFVFVYMMKYTGIIAYRHIINTACLFRYGTSNAY